MKSFSVVAQIAHRFLRSKSSDGFISLISWVSIAGVALGVLALTVVTSVINGYEKEFSSLVTEMNGDVILYSRGEPIFKPQRVVDQVLDVVPEAEAITQSFIMEMMISGGAGVAGAVVEGVDLDTVGDVTRLPQNLIQGRLPQGLGEVALTRVLAQKIGAEVGDQVRLIIPFVGVENEDGSRSAGQPRIKEVQVVGLVKMGLYQYDSKFAFATLPFVQKFLKQKGRVNSFKIRLNEKSDVTANEISERLRENFGYPFRAKSWGQLNQNLFYAIKLEKAVIAIILTIIVIVAAFNVVSTLMMMIHDKTKEIAILKAMGLTPGASFWMFAVIGLGIGVVGTIVGVSMGLAVDWVLGATRWITIPADIYYIGHLPVIVIWKEVFLIVLSAVLVSFLATLYPARQVSRRAPLEGLRYE